MDRNRSIDARIAAVARTHGGVLAIEHLRRAGIGADAIARRVRSGQLVRLFRGVYVIAPLAEDPGTIARAGVAAMGPGAAVAASTAARGLGIWARGDATIHVISPHGRTWVTHPGVRFRTSASLESCDLMQVGGVPHTDHTRTCWDLGRDLTKHQLAHVMHEARYLRSLDTARLDAMLRKYRRSPGSGTVRAGLVLHRGGSAGTRSRSEDRLLWGLGIHHVPEPTVNTRGSTNVRGIEADFVWVGQRLIVEVDGAGHDQPGAHVHDVRRDEVLTRSGWYVVRFPASRVWVDLNGVCREIAQLVATSRH